MDAFLNLEENMFEDLIVYNNIDFNNLKDFEIKTEEDTLRIKKNDETIFSFSSTQNIINPKLGINNPNPQFSLDVSGSININGGLFFNGLEKTNFKVNGSDIYYDDGNVGFGVSSPTELLHLQGTNPTFSFYTTNSAPSTINLGLSISHIQLISTPEPSNVDCDFSFKSNSNDILKINSNKSFNIFGDLRVDTDVFTTDLSTNKVGILQPNPTTMLHIGNNSADGDIIRLEGLNTYVFKSSSNGLDLECLEGGNKEFNVKGDNFNCLTVRNANTTNNQKVIIVKDGGYSTINGSSGTQALSIEGAVKSTGWIRSDLSGTFLNARIFNLTSSTITIAANQNYTTVYGVNYTPVSNNSILNIKFDGNYEIAGFGGDSMFLHIVVAGSFIGPQHRFSSQNANGGGGRGNCLLPAEERYINTSTTTKFIEIRVYTIGSDDSVSFIAGGGGKHHYMRVIESRA